MTLRKGQAFPLILAVGLIVFMIGLFAVLLGFDTVPASNYGVIEQFGQIKGVMHPGLQWTGVFSSVENYDLRIRKVVVELSGVNSAVDNSGQAVYATINVNYAVKRTDETVQSLYSNVGMNAEVADILNLNAIVAEGFKQATVKYDALEILDKRQEVKELAKENIRKNFPVQYFEIQDIVITNIDFSPQFKNAIEAKKTAEQDALTEQNQLEVVKFQQQQEVEKYKAEAEKMRLQKQEVTELLNQQKWIEKWNGVLPATVLISEGSDGTGTGQFILNIPTVGTA